MNEFFQKHYIRINTDSNIIAGFSDAFRQPEADDILINEQGGYQFRLFPDGEENPRLFTDDMIPLYRWTNNTVQPRTEAKIQAERDSRPRVAPMPTDRERIAALESAMLDVAVEMFSRG